MKNTLFSKLVLGVAGVVAGFGMFGAADAATAASISRSAFNPEAIKFDFENTNNSNISAGNLSVTNGSLSNIGSFGLMRGISYFDGGDSSVIRFDFLNPVSAFGLDFIANNANITLSIFDKANKLIESLTMDWTKVSKLNGFPSDFIGLKAGSNSIAYATIDTPLVGNELYIDNVIYQYAAISTTAVPEPASILGLLGVGVVGTVCTRKRKKKASNINAPLKLTGV